MEQTHQDWMPQPREHVEEDEALSSFHFRNQTVEFSINLNHNHTEFIAFLHHLPVVDVSIALDKHLERGTE